ncbi:MAG: hypothetical protein SGVNAXEH_000497 [Holophagaceae bacterium]|jgi:regulator of protease activity HflC (stomatin/prohibitin superfamily)
MFELFLQTPLLILLLFYGFTCISIVNEYERSVIFRLGRMVGIRGPGLIFVFRPFERQVKVSLRSIVLNVPSQDIITKDNVTLKVSAVVYYKVTNPVLAVTGVEDYDYATSQKAQTSLRSILGEVQLDQILSDREALVRRLREIVDLATEPWGVEVTSVELKSIDLPEQIQRAMGRQAEAEREKRSKIINSEGELAAAEQLLEAANMISQNPAAIQMRYLQTLSDIAVEKNSTIIFPVPMDLLKAFEKYANSEKPRA